MEIKRRLARFHALMLTSILSTASACSGGVIPNGELASEQSQGEQADDHVDINPEAFWENDPPPVECLADGSQRVPTEYPGGTPECPDDKNREGCPCPESMVGKQATCWPGLRVNRDRGICADGVTTCERVAEFVAQWGPCEGAVLPVENVKSGSESCGCFSRGRWEIENVSPCLVTKPDGTVEAVSTFQGASGARCPSDTQNLEPEPGEPFSRSTLEVDCEGQFRLCYTIKAGDPGNPSASDCVLSKSCTETWYEHAGQTQTLEPLPGWTGNSAHCAQRFADVGGYGEMSVVGLSRECQEIGSESDPLVFNRLSYCPAVCTRNPDAPGCAGCTNGGSGEF